MPLSEWKAPGEFHNGTHYVFRRAVKHINAETVVCIHGVGSFFIHYETLSPFLVEKGFNTLTYDLIGRGFSNPPSNGNYGADEHILQLYDLLEHLKLTNEKGSLHFIGHSMGGALTILFCERYPSLPKTITLLAPAGLMGFWPLVPLRNMTLLHRTIRSAVLSRSSQEAAWRKDFHLHSGESLVQEELFIKDLTLMNDNNPNAGIAFWESVMTFPMTNIKPQIKSLCHHADHLSGVYIIWGKEDPTTAYSCLAKFQRLFTKYITKYHKEQTCNVQVHTIHQASHSFMLEYPDDTNQCIFQFLQSHPLHPLSLSPSQQQQLILTEQ